MAMPFVRISADREERDPGPIPRRQPAAAAPAYAAEWHTHGTLLPSAEPAPEPAAEPARAYAAEWHTQALLAPVRCGR